MPNSRQKISIIAILGLITLVACEQGTKTNPATTSFPEATTEAAINVSGKQAKDEIQTQELAVKNNALKSPEWVSVPNVPNEWSGLYQKNCKIGGPEDSHFFEYKNQNNNTVSYFAYVTFPPALNKKPKATVYQVKYQVWQNEKWPDHYLLYGLDSYLQFLLEDGWAHGLHQTLDGQKWDIAQHMQTKYRNTDVVRWAANIDEDEDYGSTPPCDPKLAQPWTGQVFKTKDGKSLTLQKVMAGI